MLTTIALFETLELVLSDCPQTHLICTKLNFKVFHALLSVIFIVEKRNCKVIFSATLQRVDTLKHGLEDPITSDVVLNFADFMGYTEDCYVNQLKDLQRGDSPTKRVSAHYNTILYNLEFYRTIYHLLVSSSAVAKWMSSVSIKRTHV